MTFTAQQDLDSEVAFRGEQRQVPRLARFALKPGVPWLDGAPGTWGFKEQQTYSTNRRWDSTKRRLGFYGILPYLNYAIWVI